MIYKELIDLGFKRYNSPDGVHFDQTGNEYFYLSKKLCNGLEACWYPEMDGGPVGISFPDDTSNRIFITELTNLKNLLVLLEKRKKQFV